MDRLAKITTGDLLSSGIFPSLAGEGAPFWKDGENVVFDNGGVRKMNGVGNSQLIDITPTGMKATVAGLEPRVLLGGAGKAYRYRSSDGLTQIATFAGAGGVYDFVPWDTWALINNGVNRVQLWQNAGMAADIVAPFTRANCIFGYQLQAFAAGTDNGGTLVEWSPINVVTDWTPTLLNTAGNLRLRALDGDIICCKKLGDNVGIYSNVNAGLFGFTGNSALPYAFPRAIKGVKAISKYSVVENGNRHFGLTADNAFVTDLYSYDLIDEPAMRRYLNENADWDQAQSVYGWNDFANNMLRWSVPKLDGGTLGIGLRTDKKTWTRFNDTIRLGEESGPFPYMPLIGPALTIGDIAAGRSRLIRSSRTDVNLDNAPLSSFVQTKPLDLGTRNRYKRISMISLDMEWSGNVRVQLGYSDHPNQDPTWVVDEPAANEIFPDKDSQQSETVYLSLKISSEDMDAAWRLSGGEIYGKLGGNAHA